MGRKTKSKETLSLFGFVGRPGADLQAVTDQLSDVSKDAEIVVELNSFGGSAYVGLAIYEYLKGFTNLETKIVGLAASAAALVFLAGKKRSILKNSQLMFHGVRVGSRHSTSTEAELRQALEQATVFNDGLVNILTETSNLSETVAREWVDGEGWLSAGSAFEMGLATDILDPTKTVIQAKTQQRGFGFFNSMVLFEEKADMSNEASGKSAAEYEAELATLKADLDASVHAQNAAVEEERLRLRAVSELAAKVQGGAELLGERIFQAEMTVEKARMELFDVLVAKQSVGAADLQADAPSTQQMVSENTQSTRFMDLVNMRASELKLSQGAAIREVRQTHPELFRLYLQEAQGVKA